MSLGEKRLARLKHLIRINPDANIFFDETPIGGPDGIHPDDLKALANEISPENIFWIACNYNHPKKEDLEPGNC